MMHCVTSHNWAANKFAISTNDFPSKISTSRAAGSGILRPHILLKLAFCKLDLKFRVRRSRGEMYIGHCRLCVTLCVTLSVPRRIPTLLHKPGCNLGNGMRCPLVVHYWADLQSVHGFRCYDKQ